MATRREIVSVAALEIPRDQLPSDSIILTHAGIRYKLEGEPELSTNPDVPPFQDAINCTMLAYLDALHLRIKDLEARLACGES